MIHLRWKHWGQAFAYGHGVAEVNDCIPYCAAGHDRRYKGARAVASRRREGTCEDRAVRFYTRVTIEWPARAHLGRQRLRLRATCPSP